jgi:hypothetical protein
MRGLTVLALILICAGCTTLKPVTATPADLRQRINAGELLKAGDSVVIVTADGTSHRLEVTAVAGGLVQGRTESVPVDQIVSLEKRTVRAGRTLDFVLLGLLIAGLATLAAVAHSGAGLGGYH